MSDPKQISTDEMRALLANETGMSPATRDALITGVCPYDDGRGHVYQAPPTFKSDAATHQMTATIDPVATYGVPKCKLD